MYLYSLSLGRYLVQADKTLNEGDEKASEEGRKGRRELPFTCLLCCIRRRICCLSYAGSFQLPSRSPSSCPPFIPPAVKSNEGFKTLASVRNELLPEKGYAEWLRDDGRGRTCYRRWEERRSAAAGRSRQFFSCFASSMTLTA